MPPFEKTDSFASTQSLSDSEFEIEDPPLYDEVPEDLSFFDEQSGERVLVARKGELLPITQTKLKKRSSWEYALKFRYWYFQYKSLSGYL